jgi:signal transduction histidine kinase/CheY-like chemotaxis protein
MIAAPMPPLSRLSLTQALRSTPEPEDPRTRLAMLRLFYEQSLASLVAAGFLVPVHLAYAWGRVPQGVLLAWALAFALTIVLRARWRLVLRRRDDTSALAQAARWQQRAEWGSLAAGVLWAAAMAMAMLAGTPSATMYVATLGCITTVASINVLAPLPRAFLLLLLPTAGVLTILFVAMGTGAGAYFALATVAAATLATGLLRRHHRLLVQSYALRNERELLLAQAQAARDAQSRFLAAASHDLRQPVHALGLLAAQAEAQMHGRAAGATATQLRLMAQSLDALVEALLDIGRLDAGGIDLSPRPLALAPLFDRLNAEFAVLAEARGLQWRLRPSALWVHSDAVQLERMLRNLLTNALTCTSRGGVLLAARRAGDQVRLGVWDTGPGIAPEHQGRIFDEFVQLQNPGRDRRRGHGLGLAIVARLARLLGHRVVLASRPGRGSAFIVELPRAQPMPQELEAADDAAVRLAGDRLDAEPSPFPLAGRRVALVEDDAAVRDATAALLRTWGCEVWAADSAATLLRQLVAAPATPQRLICDWRLDEGDGLKAIAALRTHCGERLPALLLSAETLPLSAPELDALSRDGIVAARKPLGAAALRAWLSLPASAAGPAERSDPR